MQSFLFVSLNTEKRLEEALKFASKHSSKFDTHIHDASLNPGIEIIREIQTKLSLKPLNSDFSSIIIHNAENLTVYAQNALLKTLEEPPSKSILILTTNNPETLLPTVLSRCSKTLLFDKKGLTEKGSYEELISNLEELSLAKKLKTSENLDLNIWLNTLRNNLREQLLTNSPQEKTLNLVKKALGATEMSKYNVNKKLLSENIILD